MANNGRSIAPRMLALIGPGLLVAATGVGAGDLSTAGFAGHELGVAVLWAVALGAFLKWVLNEGLARWQLATGDTLLEGCSRRLGRPFEIVFLAYLLPWSFFVGSALVSACGVTIHAIIPIFDDANTGKIVFGVASSFAGLVLVYWGGYRLFQRVMTVCIGVMFITVVTTAILVEDNWLGVLSGLALPTIPRLNEGGLTWTIALMGGVGGTLTVLCYGYWIREEGRHGAEALRTCRIDLACGYAMTALFGICMVMIASQIELDGQSKGARLVVVLADCLGGPLGGFGRWAFLLGAFGAVFSSLLGVWQCVPLLFADFWGLVLREDKEARALRVNAASRTYRFYLIALSTIPLLNIPFSFKLIQKYYAVLGAGFMPFLAVVLLYLNGSGRWVGKRLKSHPLINFILVATLAFFLVAACIEIRKAF